MHFLMAGVTAPSHIYPSRGLIAELVRRGHRVTYSVGSRHGDLVAPTGAEVLEHESIFPTADEDWPDDAGGAMRVFLDESIVVLPLLLERVERPDAVLYDIGGLAGRVAANTWGVPTVQLSPTYVAWEGYEEDMAEHTAALKASESGQAYFATLRAWLRESGYDIDADDFLGRPEECVVLIPRALQLNADRVDPRYVFAGPCLDPARFTGWTPPPGDDRPLVYVSFGTSYTDRPDIYAQCAEQLSDRYRLVMATGKVDPATLPDTVIAARVQPQLDVLEHADVFITHAGMGGAGESLWFGVPTVGVPQAVDQFANAATLEAIGAGVQLGERTILEAVEAARQCTARARELQTQVRREGGVARAADAVERLTQPRA